MSAVCSIALVVLLEPCPDLVSIRMSTGLSVRAFSCRVAAYLNECAGTTRSSWSAVVIGDPVPTDGELVEAQHVHDVDLRDRDLKQLRPLIDDRAHQQAAV